MKKISLYLFFVIFFAIVLAPKVFAGFGISPPYVKSDKLVPGSHYEQRITLLRSSADEDLTAEVVINAPEIESWISIDKGNKFDLPKGELQVPMVVKVDVPKNAELDSYKGHINIRISPKGANAGSGVAIALGARIDMELLVTNQSYPDFIIRKIDLYNLSELGFPWNLKIFSLFLYKLKIAMKIENVGNVKTAPSKVAVEFYDITKDRLLGKGEDTSIGSVEPFQINDVEAMIPTTLTRGQYWAKIKVYKDKDIMYSEEKTFEIFPPGQGDNVPSLGMKPWLLLGAYVLAILAILALLFKAKAWKPVIVILVFIIIKPIKFIFSLLGSAINSLKLKFWRWMHEKSSKYQNYDRSKKD